MGRKKGKDGTQSQSTDQVVNSAAASALVNVLTSDKVSLTDREQLVF